MKTEKADRAAQSRNEVEAPLQTDHGREDRRAQTATQRRFASAADSSLQRRYSGAPLQRMGPAPANETGMPDQLKTGIENLSGMDLSDVRVHRNSDKPAQLSALAYAQGSDIHLAPGQEQHLPHEAWHVVQQRQGRVNPTMQMAGVSVNDDAGLEEEADSMGAKAAQLRSSDEPVPLQRKTASANAPVQGVFGGTLGVVMQGLTPARLGATGTYYANLWNALNNMPTVLAIENGVGFANFDPTARALTIRFQMLKELQEHASGKAPLPQAVLADHIAMITHEFSHAHDNLVLGKELRREGGATADVGISNVLMTEILAWEREARTRQRLLPPGSTDPLWESWIMLETDMVTDYNALGANRNANEVVMRLWNYFRREWRKDHEEYNFHQINPWFGTYWGAIRAEVLRLAGELLNARNTI